MLAKGNADPQVCVGNLVSTWKKEAFYGRRKGIPVKQQDMPFSTAEDQLVSDTEDMINEFEERVEVNDITVNYDEELGTSVNVDVEIINETLDEEEEEDDE